MKSRKSIRVKSAVEKYRERIVGDNLFGEMMGELDVIRLFLI